MGHKPGTALGRTGEGIVEPIKESTQRGRAGLGTEGVPELEPENVEWPEEEVSYVCMYVYMSSSRVIWAKLKLLE